MTKPKKYGRRCKECKSEFFTNRKDRRFCCDSCRNRNWTQNNPRVSKDRVIDNE